MTAASVRMRKSRERKKANVRVLRVEVGIETVETLIELNYLDVGDLHDLDEVASALGRFIDETASAVTRNAITLNDW